MRLKMNYCKTLITSFLLVMTLVLVSGAIADSQDLKVQNIQRAIQAQGAQWTAGDNEINQMAPEDFRKLLGWLPDEERLESEPGIDADTLVGALPKAFDWRDVKGTNYVTSIKRQQCGDCWAHAAAAALESRLIIDGKPPLDLSEQLLVSTCCNTGNCGGGYIVSTSKFLVENGIPEEDCYPYAGQNTACDQACSDWRKTAYKASSYTRVSQDVDALKTALFTRGPINVGYTVYSDFSAYKSGIYEYSYGKAEGGHAVVIVGYDDKSQCFIVKNSWGSSWGEDGYFRIAYSQVNNQVDFGSSACVYGDDINHEEDHEPPTPDPMTWETEPKGVSSSTITMTATSATDVSGVEYLFECTSGDCHDSGWQDSAEYTDTGLAPETTYTYRVMARDKSADQNETGWSAEAEATTIDGTAGIEIISPFTNGLSHTKPQGTNRLLVFSVHAEDNNTNVSATEVTYGGQPMTMVAEQHVGTTYRAYVAYFVLGEDGIEAAEGDSFAVTWDEKPFRTPGFASAFFNNVNQETPVSGSDGAGNTNSNTLELSPLATQPGDMVLVSGTCGNTGEYSLLNEFTEAWEPDLSSSDAIVGYLPADGSPLTPGVSHSKANRQVAVAMVLALAAPGPDPDPGDKDDQPPTPDPMEWENPPSAVKSDQVTMTAATAKDDNGVEYSFECVEGDCHDSGWQESPTYEDKDLAAGATYTYRVCARDLSKANNTTAWSEPASVETQTGASGVEIIGDWQNGMSHSLTDGSDRLLILTVHAEDNDTDILADSVKFGGQPMEKITETVIEAGYRAYIAVFALNEAGIAAAEGDTFTVDWSHTPLRDPGYSSVCLANVDQSQPIGDNDSTGGTAASIETEALATQSGDLAILAGVCGNTGDFTLGNGFTEAGELSLVSSDGVIGYKQADGSAETPRATHSNVNRQALAAIVVQAP